MVRIATTIMKADITDTIMLKGIRSILMVLTTITRTTSTMCTVRIATTDTPRSVR
jgi:hypothetical protein